MDRAVWPTLAAAAHTSLASALGDRNGSLASTGLSCGVRCSEHGKCVDGSCDCSFGYRGTDCEESTFGFELELLTSPISLIIALLFLLLVSIILAVVAYRYVLLLRTMGPFSHVVRQTLDGHALMKSGNVEDALATYHSAIVCLCGNLLSKNNKDVSELILEVDEALAAYNCTVYQSGKLSLWLDSKTDQGPSYDVSVNFSEGLGIEMDSECRITAAAEGSLAAECGVSIGDRLTVLNGEDVSTLSPSALQEQLAKGGTAGFRKTSQDAKQGMRVCIRCACRNRVDDEAPVFCCFSCKATAIPFRRLAMPVVVVPKAYWSFMSRLWCCRGSRVTPDMKYPMLGDVYWEDSGLVNVPRHPTGFGRTCDAPDGCQHHTQVGATCGMAAVNNLLTNCGRPETDVRTMTAISDRLGQAETAIRDGALSVEEAGEERRVLELYATADGEHFDVQTLQIALSEAGFHMWYAPPEKLQKSSTVFEYDTEFAGYVVHRKDPVNAKMDHWFVVRRHGQSPGQLLIQDSLFDKPFKMTLLELHDLLFNSPQGTVFVVTGDSNCPAPESA